MDKPLFGLVMIVKDEMASIGRCLAFVRPLLKSWTVCDTGSTDGTQELVKMMLEGIPGRLYQHKWQNYGRNRTMALARAKGTADWLLMLDADEDVNWLPEFCDWFEGADHGDVAAYQIEVMDQGITYRVPYLTRGDLDWRYVGPTHEYLDPAGRRQEQLNGLVVTHMSEKTPEQAMAKLLRDIELLRPEFEKQDPRAIFYTAECHRHLGNVEHAALLYELRASVNGFDEEKWYASYQAAVLRQNLERLIEVWRDRPWRTEPLVAAARIIDSTTVNNDVLFRERPFVEVE